MLGAASLFPIWTALQCAPDALNDDTYITLTYAKNLAIGKGFVYNHAPATLGTTTPLLALVLGGAGRLLPFWSIRDIAIWFTAICWITSAWLIYLFRKHFFLAPEAALLVAFFILTSAWEVVILLEGGRHATLLGMEMYPLLLGVVLTALLYARGYWFWAGVAAGFLFLVRGEGALMGPVLVAMGIFKREQQTQKTNEKKNWSRWIWEAGWISAGFWIVAACWFLYSQATIGSFLPDTMRAKMAQPQYYPEVPSFTNVFLTYYLKWWGEEYSLLLYLLFWLLALVGVGGLLFRGPGWWVISVWVALYTLAHVLLPILPYPWYQAIVYFMWAMAIGFGVWVFSRGIIMTGKHYGNEKIGRIIAIAFVVIVVIGRVTPFTSMSSEGYAKDLRGKIYMEAAQWMREHTDPNESLALSEVGYIGYYTENKIIDTWGLVSPEAIPYVQSRMRKDIFKEMAPDYVALMDDEHTFLSLSSEFYNNYKLVARWDNPANPSQLGKLRVFASVSMLAKHAFQAMDEDPKKH